MKIIINCSLTLKLGIILEFGYHSWIRKHIKCTVTSIHDMSCYAVLWDQTSHSVLRSQQEWAGLNSVTYLGFLHPLDSTEVLEHNLPSAVISLSLSVQGSHCSDNYFFCCLLWEGYKRQVQYRIMWPPFSHLCLFLLTVPPLHILPALCNIHKKMALLRTEYRQQEYI